MVISRKFRTLLTGILALGLLSGCTKRTKGITQVTAGSVCAATAGVSAFGVTAASISLGFANCCPLGEAIVLMLSIPTLAITAPLAGLFLAKGIKNLKKAKKLKKQKALEEAQKVTQENISSKQGASNVHEAIA